MSSHKDLTVWNKAYALTLEIYSLTKKFPKEEMFNLTSQIKRSAVSIPSNIAEGHARKGRKEFSQFLYIAFASGAELETQLLLSRDLQYVSQEEFKTVTSLHTEVMKMLNMLIQKVA